MEQDIDEVLKFCLENLPSPEAAASPGAATGTIPKQLPPQPQRPVPQLPGNVRTHQQADGNLQVLNPLFQAVNQTQKTLGMAQTNRGGGGHGKADRKETTI